MSLWSKNYDWDDKITCYIKCFYLIMECTASVNIVFSQVSLYSLESYPVPLIIFTRDMIGYLTLPPGSTIDTAFQVLPSFYQYIYNSYELAILYSFYISTLKSLMFLFWRHYPKVLVAPSVAFQGVWYILQYVLLY